RDFHVTGVQTCALPILRLQAVIAVQSHALVEGVLRRQGAAFDQVMRPASLCPGNTLRQQETTQATVGRLDTQARVRPETQLLGRSEERRVGKEGGVRGR